MRRILDDGFDRNGLSGFLLLPMMKTRVERATGDLFIEFHVFHEPLIGSFHARLKHLGFLVGGTAQWMRSRCAVVGMQGCGAATISRGPFTNLVFIEDSVGS